MNFKIKDGRGKLTIADMRQIFERIMRTTSNFSTLPLDTVEVDGEFDGYLNQETDTLWLGFAIGLRCAQRFAQAGYTHGIHASYTAFCTVHEA